MEPAAARRVEATVVFASLVGFTGLCEAVGTERAYLAVTGCLRLLDGVARRHGGAVDKYLGDSLMAVWGHPVPAARPARAAVRATLEMRERVAEYDRELGLPVSLAFHAGIASGPVVAGPVGGRVVREFHVLGDPVNLAARLKARAPTGAIWLDPATCDALGDGYACRAVGALRFKGKAHEVSVVEVLGVEDAERDGDAEAPATPLVGRDDERGRLRARAADLAAGHGGVVVLVGPEGIGKTRLVAELRASPEAAGMCWLRAPRDAAAPLPAAIDGGPSILVVEELDRAGARRAEELAARAAAAPLLVVATARDGDAPALRALRARAPEAEVVALRPLEPAAVELLLEAAASEAPLPPGLRALLVARAAGNPARLLLGAHLAPALATESRHAGRAERSSEAERRRATIVFADLTGFTAMTERLGAEAAYPIVSACMELLDETARRHGGHAEKHLGDAVMATFGVPLAIEDAPRAALNAAIEMRERVRAFNAEHALPMPLALHVGVHTGLGIAGDVSGPLLREFAVMGEPVDAAEQLGNRAGPGEILVGGDTVRLVRERFAFAPRGALQLPGVPAPIEAFELLSQVAQLRRERAGVARRVSSPLVGREREQAALCERIDALAAGRGGVVVLTAAAGLGKSRLLAEMAASAGAAVAWLEGVSLSNGRNASFHPFADLLRAWAELADDPAGAARDAARAGLDTALRGVLPEPEEAETIAPVLAGIMGLPVREVERERLARLQGEALERLVRRAVTLVLVSTSEKRPVVVAMDDLHWADASSIELLCALLPLAATRPVLFVLLARPGHAETSGRVVEAARAAAGVALAELALTPLPRAATRALLGNLFETDALPHATRNAIEEKAQGNPFFVEEVVRSLVDAGAVEVRDGRLRATAAIAEFQIPLTVEEVIQSRVDLLPLRRRTLLQVASVIGRGFGEDLLLRVLHTGEVAPPGDDDATREDLRALEAAEFLEPWDAARGRAWAFLHPLLHEVVYDTQLEARRAALHRRVADALETLPPETVPGWAAQLALHFGRAREAERAEHYLFRAGEEAARVAASSEALYFFQSAFELYSDLVGEGGDREKKARLERNVARALFFRGRLLEAEQHYERALAHLGYRVPRTAAGRVLHFLRQFAGLLASLYGPDRSHRRPAATARDLAIFELLWDRAQMQAIVSPTRFVFDNVDALMWLDRVDSRNVRGAGGYYAGVVGILSYGGISFALSRRVLRKARGLVRADDRPEQLSYGMMHFLHHLLAGDWDPAHEVAPELLEEGLDQGLLWQVTNVLNLEAVKRIQEGRYDEAAARIEALARIADHYQYELAASAQRFLRALLLHERRELSAARAAFATYMEEHAEPAFHVSALGWQALGCWLDGDARGAEEALARAAGRAREAGRLLPYHAVDLASARYAIEAERLEQGRGGPPALARQLRRSRRAARRLAGHVAWRQPEVSASEAVEAWARGRQQEARRRWRAAAAGAEALGMRPAAARIRLAAARRLAAAGDPAAGPLAAAARDELRALGLDAEAAAAAALCDGNAARGVSTGEARPAP